MAKTTSSKTAKPIKGTGVRKSKYAEELAKRAGSKTAKPTKGTSVQKSKHVEELAKRAGSKEPRKLQPLKTESEYKKAAQSNLQPLKKHNSAVTGSGRRTGAATTKSGVASKNVKTKR